MLARITGTLESVENTAIVAPAGLGVAYEVQVPAHLLVGLGSQVGSDVTFHTLQLFEGSGQGAHLTPRLFGFDSSLELRFFRLLTTVKGLGPRRALRAMAEPAPVIAAAISNRDAKTLQKLPEIGKKLAETISLELHEKMGPFLLGSIVEHKGGVGSTSVGQGGQMLSAGAVEAVEALVRLGESREQADRMVCRAMEAEPALDGADAILAAAFGAR